MNNESFIAAHIQSDVDIMEAIEKNCLLILHLNFIVLTPFAYSYCSKIFLVKISSMLILLSSILVCVTLSYL